MAYDISKPQPAKLSFTTLFSKPGLSGLVFPGATAPQPARMSNEGTVKSNILALSRYSTASIATSTETAVANSELDTAFTEKPFNSSSTMKSDGASATTNAETPTILLGEEARLNREFLARRRQRLTAEQIQAYETTSSLTQNSQLIRLSVDQSRLLSYISLLEGDAILSCLRDLLDSSGQPITSWFRAIKERFIGIYFASCKDRGHQLITHQLMEVASRYRRELVIVCVFQDGGFQEQLETLRMSPGWLQLPPGKKYRLQYDQICRELQVEAGQPTLAIIDSTKNIIYSKDALHDMLENPAAVMRSCQKGRHNPVLFNLGLSWIIE
ncbi:hypothetical protein EV182_000066 [Spiromyces aspiralis]|uniref:Uncharacterized protein n=1 Tax=Spiromyces aspiralis TaxID=68401 RepID=A0ACC1HYN1_9FUNG|nr:hypothetical protein EV182_000066 [Spiromyces aspiralis]